VVRCRTHDEGTNLPDFCVTKNYPDIVKESIRENNTNHELRDIHLAWAELVNRARQNPWSWTRVDEVIEYAKIRGIKKLGIATCVGLLPEARLLTDILEEQDFQVISICCMAGEVTPQDVEMPQAYIFCNPQIQAEILNQENTELNIMLGLCVGHDILFIRHSKADVTPLVVKDRALGHNPAVALHLSKGYYRNRFTKKGHNRLTGS